MSSPLTCVFSVNGVFVTASECARQMDKLNMPGSIVLIASMSGSITNRDEPWTAYNASKAVRFLCSASPCS